MNLKLLTLNMWRYYEWKERKEKLISFLNEQKSDIVFLQEAAYDERLQDKWSDQIHEINELLQYPSSLYAPLMEMTKWHKEPITWIMDYGFGFLSQFPIKHSELVVLPFVKKEKK